MTRQGITLSIYLGSRCNAGCLYCHREESEDETIDLEAITHKIEELHPVKINYFGGEPLLYFDVIRAIYDRFPRIQYQVTTNGLLLPRYKDELLLRNFRIVLSYDGGADGDLRHIDIPSVDLSAFQSVGLSTTLYHGNTDLKKIWKGVLELEGRVSRKFALYPHIMHDTSPTNAAYALTLEDYDSIIAQWKENIIEMVDCYEQYSLMQYRKSGLLQFFTQNRDGYMMEYGETHCVSRSRVKIDGKGREWDCLYIRDTKPEDNKAKLDSYFPNCRGCDVYAWCGGACVKSKAHNLECYFYHTMFNWWAQYSADHRHAINCLEEALLWNSTSSYSNHGTAARR